MVAIKDFEMPVCCGKCPMMCEINEYNPSSNYCEITGCYIKDISTKRHKNCPLVEIEVIEDGKDD